MSDYAMALRAAGATVHTMKRFGSYQGEWIAHVTLPDGRTGYIKDSFGSCSGCDAFEAEFGYESHEAEDHDYVSLYTEPQFYPDCAKCDALKARLEKFGRSYFPQLTTERELLEQMLQRDWWSLYAEDAEQARFLARGDPELMGRVEARIAREAAE